MQAEQKPTFSSIKSVWIFDELQLNNELIENWKLRANLIFKGKITAFIDEKKKMKLKSEKETRISYNGFRRPPYKTHRQNKKRHAHKTHCETHRTKCKHQCHHRVDLIGYGIAIKNVNARRAS